MNNLSSKLSLSIVSSLVKKAHVEFLYTSIKQHERIITVVHSIKCTHHNNNKEKPNLLMIHGSNSSMSTYLKIVDDLIDTYDVYLINLPGFGVSDLSDISISLLTTDETIDMYSYIIKEYISALRLDNLSVVGHSFGGYLSVNTAYRYPELIDKLVLINPAGIFNFGSHWGLLVSICFYIGFPHNVLQFIPCIIMKHVIEFVARFNLEYAYDLMLYSTRLNFSSQIINKFIKISRSGSYVANPLLRIFTKMNIPVGLIYSKNDVIMPVEHGECLSKAFDLPLRVIDNSGHSLQYDTDLCKLSSSLIDILKECSIPRGIVSCSVFESMLTLKTGMNVSKNKRLMCSFYDMLISDVKKHT